MDLASRCENRENFYVAFLTLRDQRIGDGVSIEAWQVTSLLKSLNVIRLPLPQFLGRTRPVLGRAKASDKSAASGWLRRGIAAHEKRQYFHALAAWKRAANFDDQEALYRIGLLYARGEGVAQSFGDAVIWYKRAAEAGHIEAQFQLGADLSEWRVLWTERRQANGLSRRRSATATPHNRT